MGARGLDNWSNWAAVCTKAYAVVLLLFPLYMDATKYVSLTRGKLRFFAAATLLYATLLLLRYLSDWIGRTVRPGRVSALWMGSSITQKAMVLFVLAMCVSAALSPYPETVWMGGARYNGLFTMLLYAAAFLLVSLYGDFTRLLTYALAAGTLLFSALGILMAYGVDPFTLYPAQGGFAELHFLSTLGNIDFCNTFLCMSVPMLGMAFVVSASVRRYLLLPPVAAGFYLLLLMDVDAGKVAMAAWLLLFLPAFVRDRARLARAAVLFAALLATFGVHRMASGVFDAIAWTPPMLAVLLCAAGVLLPNRIRRPYPAKAMRALAFVLIGLIAAGTVALSFHLALGGVDSFLADFAHILQGDVKDYYGHGRVGIWKRSWALAMTRPVIGFGPDTYTQAFTGRFADFVTETSGAAQYDAAHCEYLQYLCLYGFCGAAAYLLFLGSLLVRALRRAYMDDATLVLLSAVAIYAVQAVFGLSVVLVAPVFFVLCGLLENRLNRTARGREISERALV